jgi:hypothetical protein
MRLAGRISARSSPLGDESARARLRRALAKSDARIMLALAGIERRRASSIAVDLYARVRFSADIAPAAARGHAGRRDVLPRRTRMPTRGAATALLRAVFGEALTLPMVYVNADDVAAALVGL